MEKIFVLGSNSFSGASFVDVALQAGHPVFGVSRSPELHPAFLPYRWRSDGSLPQTFRFEQMDLNHDTDRIADTIQAFQPEWVVNFAAQSMVAESWLYPEQWYQTNVVANVKLHEKIRRFDSIRKYVHVTTPEVYGNCSGVVTEEAPFNPSTPYAASRAACDLHLKTFLKQYQFPVIFTRAANVFGPGQQLYRIIPRTILFIKTGRQLQLHGGGHSRRSFIHIRDVAAGTLQAARKAPIGETYHFSTDRFVSIRELVELICRKLNQDFHRLVEVIGERPGKDAAYLLSSEKARKTLDWTDQITLEQGLDETIAWVEQHLESLREFSVDYQHKP